MLDVGDQILNALETHGKPEQIGRAWATRALDARAMLDQAFDATERRGPLPDIHSAGAGDGGSLAALDPHRQHAAKPALHLARGNCMARM